MTVSGHRQTTSSSAVVKVACFLSSVLALLLVSLPLFSQGSQGTINGGVFDSTGGTIAGAKVTIVDVARGTTRSLTTDEAGKYVAPSLTTGTYTVRAEASRFPYDGTPQRAGRGGSEYSRRSYAGARRTNPDHHGHGRSPGNRYHLRHPGRNCEQPGDSSAAVERP